jgi:hypothetical protein
MEAVMATTPYEPVSESVNPGWKRLFCDFATNFDVGC